MKTPDQGTAHPHGEELDAVRMWENLCLVDELLEECEALAAAPRTPPEPAPAPES